MNVIRWLIVISTLFFSSVLVAEWQDPTRPSTEAFSVLDMKHLELQAILISPTRRLAEINGQWVREGQQVGDIKILKIDPNTVQLEDSHDRMILQLTTPTAQLLRQQGQGVHE